MPQSPRTSQPLAAVPARVTSSAVSLEAALRAATLKVRHDLSAGPNQLIWRPGWSADLLSDQLSVKRGHVPGMRPDGGAWFQPGNPAPLVIAEAKKQGTAGNAIERWYKNFSAARALGCGIYVTFCSGAGFFEGNRPQTTLELALALDPAERDRLERGTVWNHPVGRVWLYRWQDAKSVPPGAIETVLRSALRLSLSQTLSIKHSR